MTNDFRQAEADASCPVTLTFLGELYRADPAAVATMLTAFSEDHRARLAIFCYGRAHLRNLALKIAETCDAKRLGEIAGTLGQVLAAQCRAKVRGSFGLDPSPWMRAGAKISLGGTRC
jgi:hypothetical protein